MSGTKVREFSPEQQEVIHSWGEGMAVLAGAGSGKTTTLVAKCAELMRRNPQARFVAVSFTERSASDLKDKLTQELLGVVGAGALYSHWITTIHGLCAAVIREYPRQAGWDGEESVLTEAEAQLFWENAIESLWMDNLPQAVLEAFDRLVRRESQDSLTQLLRRVKDLSSLGILDYLKRSEDPDTQALFVMAQYVVGRYDRMKRRQGLLDFNDLEIGADRALHDDSIREVYHRRFDLVLVDEFQDTNPLQAQIIRRLARSDASNLCVVGDPKQSIYRFRDADVTVFEEFCSRLKVQKSLSWNFRSVPGVLDFANPVSEKAFAASDLRFDPLIPKREKSLSTDAPVLRLELDSPEQLGAWIREQVNGGKRLEDFALLLKKIRGNEKWLKALNAMGIPLAVGSGGLFWEEPRVRELVAFLKWWDNPVNSLAGGVFLRAPWVGIQDGILDQWVRQDPTWVEPFFTSEHPLAMRLQGLRDQVKGGQPIRPAELLLSLLIDDRIEAELGAPLLGLWHRAEELSTLGLSFHEVVREFARATRDKKREREVPAPRNLGQLFVLTLHGAKGLEFPYVILVDLGQKSRSPDSPLLYWDREKGAYLGKRDADGGRLTKDPDEKVWRELEKQKNLAESKRLFYVALTRARERLILVCPDFPALEDLKAEFSEKSAFSEDYWRAWVECSGVDVPTLRLSGGSLEKSPPSLSAEIFPSPNPVSYPHLIVPMRPRHSVTEWSLLARCGRAYDWTFIHKVDSAAALSAEESLGLGEGSVDQAAELDSNQNTVAGPLAKLENQKFVDEKVRQPLQELGSRIHACLARQDYEALEALPGAEGSEKFAVKPLIQWAKNSPWMERARPQEGREVWTELAFEIPIQGEILVGSIDRVICVTEGGVSRYTVLDFKVTAKPKAIETLIRAYQVQMELYAQALMGLEPSATPENIDLRLVNITPQGVQVVALDLDQIPIRSLIQESNAILQGAPSQARPGFHCRFCDFRNQCDVSATRTVEQPGPREESRDDSGLNDAEPYYDFPSF